MLQLKCEGLYSRLLTQSQRQTRVKKVLSKFQKMHLEICILP